MSPYISGKKEPAQRKLDFCVGAKICSGKAKTREEAVTLCNAPKPEKPEGTGKKRRSKKADCPAFDAMSLMPNCEKKLGTVVRSGELPSGTDITGICQLILG
jgi:hypothetical protein